MTDYSNLDQPLLLQFIFYPRKDFTPCPENGFDLPVRVGDGVSISCRFYMGHHGWPWILFFHGNGEVVSDYDGISPLYHQKEMNLVVADYRGYGASTGAPTLTDLVQDAHVIFKEVKEELSRKNLQKDLWVMGRSLGSISALELAYHHQEEMKGLIIESGFPSVVRIMFHLGMPAHGMGLEKMDQECLERIEKIFLPTLILHGEQDSLVPLENARDIYRHLGTRDKKLLVIPSATHNDIMLVGIKDYFQAIRQFMDDAVGGHMTERRKGKRYVVPEIYREYITFKFNPERRFFTSSSKAGSGAAEWVNRDADKFVTMELLDFSSHGIRFKSPLGVPVDSAMECLISAPKSLTKEVPFTVKIKYCIQDDPHEEYLIGAEIIETSNKVWFEVFSNVHDFIKKRIGKIY